MNSLVVSEVFGPTVQGEGPSCGRRATFVRLGLCNLNCGAGEGATWACDTPYTWDWRGELGTAYDRTMELTRTHEYQVAYDVRLRGARLVVVTGGEPLVQRGPLGGLLDHLLDHEVEVETNGTLDPGDLAGRVVFNVSPKLANSGVALDRRRNLDALGALAEAGARFKFVVTRPQDLDEIDELVALVGIDPGRVWVMPGGTHHTELALHLGRVAGNAIARGYNVTTRLHVELWGNRRGV